YRLYDIDLFLNRSLVYATLTVLLLGAYLGLVAVLSPLFAGRMRVGALVATAVVALIFEPLRSRLQRAASRLLYGDRDDPYAAVSRLGRRLEQSVDPSDVLPQVTETVAEVLHLPYAAIEAVDGDRRRLVASYGRRVMESEAFRMIYQGDEVGALLVTPRSPSDVFTTAERRLLEDLARQIGVAVQAARLTSDLQRSRERLVRSREEERRRLRRDLHDGLGPTLAGMTMQVGAARARLAEQGQVVEVLAGLEAGLQACVAEIRRLVEGLRPPVLDQLGLVGAIRHLVMAFNSGPGHSTPTIGMTASDGLGELPAAVEMAAYRIVTEAVTNTVRHARASRCEVRLTVQDRLILEISDDGVGLPGRHHPGVGLSSMRERAEELGGRFVIKPVAGGGTLMHAELPLDAR
ncbi:MAG: GAF domain-containing sensor histidine kinase, partial [Actinomycetota bacterium]|nr:GAF domain-containing sensor histidine kinase [Actinomycetota bacterium]